MDLSSIKYRSPPNILIFTQVLKDLGRRLLSFSFVGWQLGLKNPGSAKLTPA